MYEKCMHAHIHDGVKGALCSYRMQVMAAAGVAARRACEKLIEKGVVKVR
jgi:hypothetical protein